jgi:hypothetical protein
MQYPFEIAVRMADDGLEEIVKVVREADKEESKAENSQSEIIRRVFAQMHAIATPEFLPGYRPCGTDIPVVPESSYPGFLGG